MISVRRSEERGHFDHGWLDTRHTFSFGDYYDEAHMGFRDLRVINEDRVQPRTGFPTHGHRDMEIISYVLAGEIEHKDSTGTHGVLKPGEVQRMTAGTGVRHSEMNRGEKPLHFLQIWIIPERQGLAPGYEQKAFADDERKGRWRLLASPDGAEGSLTVHQDVKLYGTLLDAGAKLEAPLAAGRHAWVQLARGRATLNGTELSAGDGAAVSDERALVLTAKEPVEALFFDLA